MQVNFSTVIVLNHKHDPIHMPKFKCKWKKKGGGGVDAAIITLVRQYQNFVGLIIIQAWNLTPQVMANQAYTCESNHCTQICWRHHRFTAEVFSSCRILKERERAVETLNQEKKNSWSQLTGTYLQRSRCSVLELQEISQPRRIEQANSECFYSEFPPFPSVPHFLFFFSVATIFIGWLWRSKQCSNKLAILVLKKNVTNRASRWLAIAGGTRGEESRWLPPTVAKRGRRRCGGGGGGEVPDRRRRRRTHFGWLRDGRESLWRTV